jgi:hypothetical protein
MVLRQSDDWQAHSDRRLIGKSNFYAKFKVFVLEKIAALVV